MMTTRGVIEAGGREGAADRSFLPSFLCNYPAAACAAWDACRRSGAPRSSLW